MNDETLDYDEFLERVQGDKDLLLELFDIYTEDFRAKRKLLGEAVQKKSGEEIRNIAHSLKGASGNISAKSLRQSFLKIEEMSKKNEYNEIQTYLGTVDQQFSKLLQRIESVKKELETK